MNFLCENGLPWERNQTHTEIIGQLNGHFWFLNSFIFVKLVLKIDKNIFDLFLTTLVKHLFFLLWGPHYMIFVHANYSMNMKSNAVHWIVFDWVWLMKSIKCSHGSLALWHVIDFFWLSLNGLDIKLAQSLASYLISLQNSVKRNPWIEFDWFWLSSISKKFNVR